MSDPAWINADTGAPAYSAVELRRLFAGLLFGYSNDRFAARPGILSTNVSPVVTSTTWDTADLHAVVYPGLTSTSGPYLVAHPADSGTIDPPDATNPRIDALDLQIRDDDEDASGFRDARIVYVAGTPGASPVPPALTANSLRLVEITVPASGGGSPTSDVVAQRTGARGGILVLRPGEAPPVAQLTDGVAVYDVDQDALLIRNAGAWRTAASVHGFQFRETVVFIAGGTFDKADYTGIRAVRVRAQGLGGGGGGTNATAAGEAGVGSGGGGGQFREGWILDAADLAASETVTIGARGSAGTDHTVNGGAGGSSSFGTHVIAAGGGGGTSANVGTAHLVVTGGNGGTGGSFGAAVSGGVTIAGSDGDNGYRGAGFVSGGLSGGASYMGGSQRGNGTTAGGNGATGQDWGGGGAGGHNNESQATVRSGGLGGAGIVVVDVFV